MHAQGWAHFFSPDFFQVLELIGLSQRDEHLVVYPMTIALNRLFVAKAYRPCSRLTVAWNTHRKNSFRLRWLKSNMFQRSGILISSANRLNSSQLIETDVQMEFRGRLEMEKWKKVKDGKEKSWKKSLEKMNVNKRGNDEWYWKGARIEYPHRIKIVD